MDTRARAEKYLVESQLPDGAWGSGDPLVCARAMYALWGDMPDTTRTNGLRYLTDCQAPDGRFSQKTGTYSDATGTAYSLIVLNRFDYGKASLPVSRGMLWLLENQNEDGSWGTNKKKKAYTTTFCLRALHTFYLSGIRRFARGLEFSINYLEELDLREEPVSHVYAPVLNLKRMGMLDDGLEKRFRDRAGMLISDAIDKGNVSDAAYILGTFRALGERTISPIIEEWLRQVQNEDGSYGKELGSPGEANWTALVLLATENRL